MGLFKKSKKAATAEQVVSGIDGSNLTAIVTGGNAGLGAETVRVLAKQGVRVVIAARNVQSAETVRDAIIRDRPEADVRCMPLDLASLDSVRDFVNKFLDSGLPLNILINNAGIMFGEFKLSKDNVEMQFATNHLGHFLLTNLLLEKMKETAESSGIPGRIVILSSVAHKEFQYKEGILDIEALNDPRKYDQQKAYGQSKLANLLHARYLGEKLKSEGVNVTVNAVHPGIIETGLWNKTNAVLKAVVKMIRKWTTIEEGAATTVYVALHPDCKDVTGEYFVDCRIAKGKENPVLGEKLWKMSEQLVAGST